MPTSASISARLPSPLVMAEDRPRSPLDARWQVPKMGPNALLIRIDEWGRVNYLPELREGIATLVEEHQIRLLAPPFRWTSAGLLVNLATPLDLAKFRLIYSGPEPVERWRGV